MKPSPLKFSFIIYIGAVLIANGALAAQPPASGSTDKADDPKKAWSDLVIKSRPVLPDTRPTTPQAREVERRNLATAYVNASAAAREFYTKHADDPNAAEAKKLEVVSLLRAVETGEKGQKEKAHQIGRAFREDKSHTAARRFEVAALMNQQRVRDAAPADPKKALEEYENTARGLIGEFNGEPQAYELFWGVARNSPPAKAKAMAQELLVLPASEAVKLEARRFLERLAMIGRPAELNFTADDGSAFDLQNQKGKVHVIYVWGNLSQGSLAALPAIKAAVRPGVTFIGVNVDRDVAAAKATARREDIPGVQVYDREGLDGAPAHQLRLGQIPAVYVVDAKGVLRGVGSPSELPGLLAEATK